MPQQNNIIQFITNSSAPEILQQPDVLKQLNEYINYLINHDFPALVQLLYRIDISEKKIKEALQLQDAEDGGALIAKMIIERQLQKIKSKSKQSFSKSDENIISEDEW
ncbi:MAG: hypothetical protein ABJA79_11485 [Parafilimonas sp.]